MLRPLGDRVIVKRLPAEDKAGRFFLPDQAKEKKPRIGDVLAVGPGEVRDDGTRRAPDVQKGDRVLFSTYAGSDVRIDGKDDVVVLREAEILAVIEPEAAARVSSSGASQAIAALLLLAVCFLAGCSTVSDAHLKADRDVYAANAPNARAGGMSSDDDYVWRRQCGYPPTATACPGGPQDPALAPGGLPKPFPPAGVPGAAPSGVSR